MEQNCPLADAYDQIVPGNYSWLETVKQAIGKEANHVHRFGCGEIMAIYGWNVENTWNAERSPRKPLVGRIVTVEYPRNHRVHDS